MSTSYFVTGASRGIGQELVTQLASKPDTSVVFAAVRNPSSASQELRSHPKIKVVKLDVISDDDTAAAVETVKASNDGALDVLILNAGAGTTTPMTQSPVAELREYIEVNAISTHRLVIAFLPLLRAGRRKEIIGIGTSSGSFGLSQPLAKQGFPLGAYGVSKAAMHFLVMLYAAELQREGFKCITFHPGVVDRKGQGVCSMVRVLAGLRSYKMLVW